MRQGTLACVGRAVAAVVLALGLAGQAQAAPLGLTTSLPDIAASAIALNYDATTQLFSATSTAPLNYNPGGLTLFPGSYSLTATIDNAGNLVGAGLLSISAPGLALTASLTQFGFNAAGVAILEFLGTVTADTGAGFGVGTTLGVIMNSQISGISFAQSFSQSSTAAVSSDNFRVPVPEPTTLSLLALGALAFGAARRRRQ